MFVGIALVVAVSVVVLQAPRPALFEANEMEDVVAASANLSYRPSTARLSADFPYRGVRPASRGEKDDSPAAGSLRLLELAVRLQEKVEQQPSTARLHALGVARLLTNSGAIAVETLEQAVKSDAAEKGTVLSAIRRSRNAALLNDLAAAYQTLIEAEKRLDLKPLALDAAQRAFELEPTPASAWTRAVVIEAHHVRDAAISAWKSYLSLDPRSEWAVVARERLHALEQPRDADAWPQARASLLASRADDSRFRQTVDRFRQEVRLWCEDELLPSWGEAVLKGDPSAPALLEKIGQLATALEQVSGERQVADAVEAIRKASSSMIGRLARGHAAYGAGRKHTRNPEPAKAMQELDVAVAALTPELTPFAWIARVEHAVAVYQSNDYDRARAAFNQVTRDAGTRLSNPCLGRIHAMLGIMALQAGSLEEGETHFRRALDAFRRAGERDHEAVMLSRLVSARELSGEFAEARSYRDEALRMLDGTGDPRHRHDALIDAAVVAIGNDHQAAAELYFEAVVANAKTARMHARACTALMWRAAYRHRRQLATLAAEDLRDADRTCATIPDPFVRERYLATLELAKFSVGGSGLARPHAGLDGAIAFFRKTNLRVLLRSAYFARAKAAERDDPASAERDYRAALDEIEAVREKIDERQTRISFTATADEIADGYIEFLLRQKRERDAFETADGIRLRELVDSPTARWPAPQAGPLVQRIQSSLPFGTALVAYRVLSKSIAVWVVAPDRFATVMLPVSIDDLRDPIAALDREASQAVLIRNASILYDALLRRIESHLDGAAALVIVPDDELERVPYGALYDRLRGRFVMATRATLIAPGASLFIEGQRRARERSTGDDRVLVIKAADGGSTSPPLPEAVREAESLARMYPNARIVDASDDRGSRILLQARDVSLLQFVGHTTVESDRSMRTLRLGEGAEARLGVADIVSAQLPRLRLVYLSACETDTGPILKSEGSVTIARSFFAAGVPIVVGTLWPVGDDVARHAARSFHEHLRRGDTPAEALRQAQLNVFTRFRSSADWAAFRVIGAGV